MGKYNLDSLEEYFQEWFSPSQLVGILRRVGMNMAIASLQSKLLPAEICEDLEDLKTFTGYLEKINDLPLE